MGSTRRIDIIAFDNVPKYGYVIDPTVRMENGENQPEEVNKEKQEIYNACITDLLQKYQLKHIEVIGLLIGARGTITKFFEEFRGKFRLPKSLRDEVVLTAL